MSVALVFVWVYLFSVGLLSLGCWKRELDDEEERKEKRGREEWKAINNESLDEFFKKLESCM